MPHAQSPSTAPASDASPFTAPYAPIDGAAAFGHDILLLFVLGRAVFLIYFHWWHLFIVTGAAHDWWWGDRPLSKCVAVPRVNFLAVPDCLGDRNSLGDAKPQPHAIQLPHGLCFSSRIRHNECKRDSICLAVHFRIRLC